MGFLPLLSPFSPTLSKVDSFEAWIRAGSSVPQEQLQVQHRVVPHPIPKGPIPFPGALSHP